MDTAYKTTLELYKVLNRAVQLCACQETKEMMQALEPAPTIEDERYDLTQTNAINALLIKNGSPRFGSVREVRRIVAHARKGGILSMGELLEIAATLRNFSGLSQWYGLSEHEMLPTDDLFFALAPQPVLEKQISESIISPEEMADTASVTLHDLRRKIRQTEDSIRTKLDNIIRNSTTNKFLQDAVVSLRNGRYVVPVRAEYRGEVGGVIHDVSSTGATVFVEPTAVVEANARIMQLRAQEQEEITRILTSFSTQVASLEPQFTYSYDAMLKIDLLLAKARLAVEQNAFMPAVSDTVHLKLNKARHPLIDKKKVVPVDIELGSEYDTLVITGPNTGGKTVSLKTVGLLTLMGQSGLHIPAGDRSELAIFHEIFADIGDEQSIEQSLSTFSSHMTNIVRILQKADDQSLCLFDELCAGTDPTEGAALAISILNKLHQYGAVTMATTHYSELKVYALSTEGVENACCEFDVDTLSPTYRLLIGIPGKSNAFAISSKLGLAENIIEDAKGRLSERDVNFEDMLANLEQSRITIEKEQLEIQKYKAEIEDLKKKLTAKNERLDNSRDEILRKANEEAVQILKEAKDLADETIRNFNKYGQGQAPMSKMEKERSRVRDKMSASEKALSMKKKETVNHKVPKKLRIGDSVRVLSMNLKGTVHTLPNAKGDLYVQMGILRSLVNIKDLVLIDEDASPAAKKYGGTSSGKIKMSKAASVSTEINLIGMTVDEAIAHLDKYLDDAYVAHLPSVRIVHGKGTGALRNAVQAHLKNQRYVKSYRMGEPSEGGAGVTIAAFDV